MDKLFRQIFLGAALVIAALLLHYLGWLRPVENIFFKVTSPIQRGVYHSAGSLGNFYYSWLTKRDLLAENATLRQQLENSNIDRSLINSLTAENESLKQELNFVENNKIKTITAKIITGTSDQVSRSVVISAGSQNGIVKGLAVVAEGGVIVGKVSEVYPDFSKVVLLTDNASRLAATVQNGDRTAGLVEGQFGLGLAMTNIPQNQAIVAGDLIVTSGLEGLIPKNLLIARVDSVHQVESDIFKTATLQPIVSFDNLSYVLVLIP